MPIVQNSNANLISLLEASLRNHHAICLQQHSFMKFGMKFMTQESTSLWHFVVLTTNNNSTVNTQMLWGVSALIWGSVMVCGNILYFENMQLY